MRGLKTQAPVRLYGAIAVLTAMMVISLGSLNQSRVAIAQTPLIIDQPSSLAQVEPIYVNPIESRVCPRDLEAAIASIIESPRFNTARWGILIEPISEATVLYQHNPNTFLIPASNIKLLTTAAALRIIGDRTPENPSAFEDWITVINRDSNNNRADALLRRIGGQSAVRLALTTLGVNPTGYTQVDGSGLSRNNRAKPSTFVSLLKGMYNQEERGLFYRSLSIAGINGTLRNRFQDTLAQGRVHAKTGTLQGVRALSGYIENSNYGPIAFSMVVNQSNQSGQVLTQAIDQIVLKTTQVTRCYF